MREQVLPGLSPRRELSARKRHVGTDSVGRSRDRPCGFVRSRVCVRAHLTEVMTKPAFHRGPDVRIERLAGRIDDVVDEARDDRTRVPGFGVPLQSLALAAPAFARSRVISAGALPLQCRARAQRQLRDRWRRLDAALELPRH